MRARGGRAELAALLQEPIVALETITLLRLASPRLVSRELLGRSQAYFPAVGLGLGALLYGCYEALPSGTSAALTGWLLVSGLALLTRGFHLDGLADLADGVWGGATPERRLEIMKGSAIGVFGAAALIAVLAIKAAALGSLPSETMPESFLLAPAFARAAAVGVIAAYPSARPEGLGVAYREQVRYRPLITALLTVVLAGLVLANGEAFLLLGGLVAAALLFGRLISGALGGLTGDCYGAIIEISETAVFAIFAMGYGGT